MGVIMQAFYWDCPEDTDDEWWNVIKNNVPSLSEVGFTDLWLPPASKGANIGGMGYDPYDYYDLGASNSIDPRKTWFGSEKNLLDLIHTAHDNNMYVYADLVIHHNSGGDEEINPIDNIRRWTKFNPASGKFPRDWNCFHPSLYETWDNEPFGDMPGLCHRNPYVYKEILEYARWLIEDIEFDGFRYDFVKGYGIWMICAIQEFRYTKDPKKPYGYKPYGVGEFWDSERNIEDWLDEANKSTDNPVGAFDFPLRGRLKDLCDNFGYSLRNLVAEGTLLTDRPSEAVTFVDNHDLSRNNPIKNVDAKMLAYAFILTHEGYPCVFWQGYYNCELAQEGYNSGIASLVKIHEVYAGGTTSVLHVDDDLYIMQRNGNNGQKGLIFVLNNRGNGWNGKSVQTKWANTKFVPGAWRGLNDTGIPDEITTYEDGSGEFRAPPRGYTVYLPVE